MKKIILYFLVGIIPIVLFTLSPVMWKNGSDFYNSGSTVVFGLMMIAISIVWGLAAYNIRLGYEILDKIYHVILVKRVKIRLVKIEVMSKDNRSECSELFYFEKLTSTIAGRKWKPVKNCEIFREIPESNSIAYFADRKNAIERLQDIKKGRWNKNHDFDRIIIEEEFYI